MELNPQEAANLAMAYKKKLGKEKNKEVVICPSFLNISEVKKVIDKTQIVLGAQDCFWAKEGAYTGEVSPSSLRGYGCDYVIVGHSERRRHLKETNAMIAKKINAVLDCNMTPVLCVGENFDERAAGDTDNVIFRQLTGSLNDIMLVKNEKIIIAYEPVWAIGSGKVATAQDVQEAFALIYQVIRDIWPNSTIENNVRLIYGGSIDGVSAGDFSKVTDIDGFLVGGASLDIDEFFGIVNSAMAG